ncbi:hypothetical protein UG55_106624 [Frankia sp. EI5c]|nr:hypothetical protein UG55_106624 [Frankia sp. EI5c]
MLALPTGGSRQWHFRKSLTARMDVGFRAGRGGARLPVEAGP